VLLERERELAAVHAVLERGGILVVEGGPGIGKTSLLEAAAAQAAEADQLVLRARASELDTGFGFGVVRQLLERWVAECDADERERLFAGPARAARPVVGGEDAPATVEDTSFAVLHGLYWVLSRIAEERPAILTVDDAHWADEPSLRWLAYLAARLEGLPVALLLALRPGEPGAAHPALAGLRAQSELAVPAVLSQEAVSRMVRSALGGGAADELCAAVGSSSGGNPFYVRELLRTVGPGASPEEVARSEQDVAERVLVRIGRLGDAPLRLAQAVGVLGDGCRLGLAAHLAGLEEREASIAAAELVRLDVLAEPDPFAFIHPIVRRAIDSTLDPAAAGRAHAAAALMLHEAGAPAGQVGTHLLNVAPAGDPWVLARLREVAREALDSGAPETAAHVLDRALEEPPPADELVAVLREAGRADDRAARTTSAGRLEQALELATDPRERAEIALELAWAYDATFRWVDAVEVLDRIASELGDEHAALAGRLEGKLVAYAVRDAHTAPRVPEVIARLATRPLEGGAAESLAVAATQAASYEGRPIDEVAAPLEQFLANSGDEVEDWDTRPGALNTLIVCERYDTVAAALEPMRTEVARTGHSRGLVVTYVMQGLLEWRLGNLPEAEAAARMVLEVVEQSAYRRGLGFAVPILTQVLVEAGELAEAEAAIGMLPQSGWTPSVATVPIPAARGWLRLAQGRHADALADFEACGRMMGAEVWGIEMRDQGFCHWKAGAALALVHLDERGRAVELADAEVAENDRGTPRALGLSLRILGLAQGGEEGRATLERSVETLRITAARLELAHSLAALGAALRRDNQRVAARERLRAAAEIARSCGAVPLLEKVNDELAASGLRVPRRTDEAEAELTPSELRIARMAAGGASNPEIAQALFLTVKTIEMHLGKAYRKLGIKSRYQLAAALPET
jgi:DNA-binding CsgD family transcriptional regulator